MKKVITALTATAAISTYGLSQDASANNGTGTHSILNGDTLWGIAQSNGLTVDQLKSYNNLSSDLIHAGSELKLSEQSKSTPSTYTVKAGDTLWGIGNRYNVSVADLKEWNNLSSDLILVNQTLTLKGEAKAEAPVEVETEEVEETEVEVEVEDIQVNADTYTVKPGDTLYSIASEFGMTYRTLMSINGLTDYLIYPGDVLNVSGEAQTVEVEEPAEVEETPVTEEVVEEEAPAEEAPVQEEEIEVEAEPVVEEAPAQEEIVEETEETPAAEEAPVEEEVAEVEPAQEEAVEEAEPEVEETSAEEEIAAEEPVQEEVAEEVEEEAPAIEEETVQEEEIEEEAEPVVEEAPVEEEVAEEVAEEEPEVEAEPVQEEVVEEAEETPAVEEEVIEEEPAQEEVVEEEPEVEEVVEEEPEAQPEPSNITGDSYTVQSGDTLASIAKRAGMSYNDIMTYNEMDSVLIYPGLTLDLVDNRPAEAVQEEAAVEETVEEVQPEPTPEPVVEEVVESEPEPVVEETQTPEVQAPAATTASYGTNWYPHGECTWYAFERRQQLGKPASGSWGDARNWASAARSQGLAVNNTPSVGAIIQSNAWQNGAYGFGHVGVVEQVNPDGSIMISEMNWSNGLGGKSFRTLSASQAASHNFIH